MPLLNTISKVALRLATQGTPFFDGTFIGEIAHVGIHPFIMVRTDKDDSDRARFLTCITQNDVGSFVQELSALPGFDKSKLIQGLERALQLEIYDAADLLYSWLESKHDAVPESIHIGHLGHPTIVYHPAFFGYPAFGFGTGAKRVSIHRRRRLLLAAFHAYYLTKGNDALRFAIMEAMALSLSRSFGKIAKYNQAADVVSKALENSPRSIHLKAAKHALSVKIAAKPLHPRFEKFIGDDNEYLKSYVCMSPFDRFDVGPDGNVMLCCGHWLPTSVGNFIHQPVDSILNSATAIKIRRSVTDGSYKYCNHVDCGAMVRDDLTKISEVPHLTVGKSIATDDFRVDHPTEVMFAFDQTCNLSCPSCRTKVITEKVSQSVAKARAVEEKFTPLLSKAKVLHINPAGELFASKPSRKVLELINDETCPDIRLAIISNGTLFSEEEWNKFPGIHNKIKYIRISIDAATKQTFEKLRRLGKYETFCENMRFLRHLRATVVPQLRFSFTYQIDNFREMPEFVDFCEEMHADYAIFERLHNIVFTAEEYREKAVHYPSHRFYEAFIAVTNDPKLSAPCARHDFDYIGFRGRMPNSPLPE